MKLITVTLNPAIDTTLITDGCDNDRANHILNEISQAGGKGVNVSRAAASFFVKTMAFALTGEGNLNLYTSLLGEQAGEFVPVATSGNIRENLTVRCAQSCIKFNRTCKRSDADVEKLRACVLNHIEKNDLVAVSGSLPHGVSRDAFLSLCEKIKAAGARLLLDTESADIEFIKRVKPFAIKPNSHEFAALFGKDAMGENEMLCAAKELSAFVDNILISLGGDGMLAFCEGNAYRVHAAKIKVLSTVCAGDSALAGFAVGVMRYLTVPDCLRLSCACGSAAAAKEGSGVCDMLCAGELLNKTTLITL